MKSDQQQPTDPTENWLRQTLGGYRPKHPPTRGNALRRTCRSVKTPPPARVLAVGRGSWHGGVALLFWFLKSAAPRVEPPAGVKNGSPVAQTAPAVLPKNLEAGEPTKIWSDKSPESCCPSKF